MLSGNTMVNPLQRCTVSVIFFLLTTAVFSAYSLAANKTANKSIAFYYADIDSVRELLSYQRVVVEPTNISPLQLQQLKIAKTEVYAYLSIGETNYTTAQKYPAAVIGSNKQWQAKVMDVDNLAWRTHLIQQAQQYSELGFDGLFLDTLDSYELALNKQFYPAQQHALVTLLDQLEVISGKLILNRGFKLLNQLQLPPSAVVAESLIHGFDVANNHYFVQNAEDTLWLTNQLEHVKQQGIEAIVIDYLPPNQQQRILAAKAVHARGYTPYISDGLLSQFGVSNHYPIPRRILGFYDGTTGAKNKSYCHRYLSTLIEYYGYVPQCEDIHNPQLNNLNINQFAATLLWLPQTSYNNIALQQFIKRALDQVPTVFIGELPDNSGLLTILGFEILGTFTGKLSLKDAKVKYPLPHALPNEYTRYGTTDPKHHVQFRLQDQQQQQGIAVAQTSWGGVMLQPLNVQEFIGERSRWPLDPFLHLMPLLRLDEIPVPDITTESGLRIVTAHIDGDGFPSIAWLPDKPYAGQSIYDNILTQSTLPHTVSVIEAEVAQHGLYPDIAPKLEQIARKIFSLDNVEVASHTFSHPFFWDDQSSVAEKLYGNALPVPNYEQDLDREIYGSVNYINQQLAPKDKPVKVFLWTGMADPSENVIAKTQQLGLLNVNGGNTFVVNNNFSISQVSPHLNWYRQGVQVYAPVINENLYTALWTENFHGFARVTETFELLGHPRRLKPVSIYYHMYSGVYPSSIAALKHVYQWAEQQPLTALYLSEYAQRARTLYETGIARSIHDNNWYISSTGITSLRINDNDILSANSEGIAGVNSGPDGRYVSLIQARSKLSLATTSPEFNGQIYLKAANGIIKRWQKSERGIALTILSHQPLKLTLANTKNCLLNSDNHTKLSVVAQQNSMTISSQDNGSFNISLSCSAINNEKHSK
jgi:polysaccharide biosynthesis protein PelA